MLTHEPSSEPSVAAQLAGVVARLDAFEQRRQRDRQLLDGRLDRVMEVLHRIFDGEQADRHRLAELRASADYSGAFTDPEPLVSIVIPTWSNVKALMDTSLPSVLAQDHPAIEVIVVGDAAPPGTAAAIAALGDPRVRFENLTMRGPYPSDPHEAWLAAGTQPYNAAVRLARGRWIAPMSDDDRLEPHAVSALLALAREQALEFVYGKLRQILPDGTESTLGSFPPEARNLGLQASIYHAGLSFMELELGHALFGTPNDWGLIRRMCLAGVRVGFLDDVVTTYWPSLRSAGPPPIEELPTPVDAGLLAERDRAAADAAALQSELADLQRRFNEVVSSRRWRWTSPVARAVASARRRT